MPVSDNKLVEMFDYRHQSNGSRQPVNLEDWLRANPDKLNNKRIFYVIKANLEPDITKFGITTDGGNSAQNRMKQYLITYGKNSSSNRCTGVKLWYMAGTEYNRLVQTTNTLVHKKELYLKRELKSKSETEPGRGTERTKVSPPDLMRMIDRASNKTTGDVVTDIRKSARIEQAEVKRRDTIVDILKRSGTKFLVKWSRPYVDPITKKSVSETWETEKFINESKGGKDALVKFKK